jgi:hypothetical protein
MPANFRDPSPAIRRTAERYTFEARIRIRLRRAQQDLNLGGWVRDMSESGLGAFVAESLQTGELVTLELPLTNGKELIPARVVRSLGTQYGFEFIAVSAAQRTALRTSLEGKPLLPIVRQL